MKAIILSDIHLDASVAGRPYLESFARDLVDLVGVDTDRLIILGDLFDFWFEYRHVIFSGYFDVLRTFAGLRDRGVKLHLICGNHDFWAGRFLRDDLGFEIYQGPVTMDFNGLRALMLHGDGFNSRDIGYRLYKYFARARPVVALFGLIHPDAAMWIARRVSRTSRRLTHTEDPMKGVEAKALAGYAERLLAEGKADVIISGHAHAPATTQFPTPTGTGTYINAGDWMYHRSYVLWTGTEFQLKKVPVPVRS